MTEPINKHANSSLALVREPGLSFTAALSSHADKNQIDHARAFRQHRGYVRALEEAGMEILSLPPLDDFPDSTFVEDTAVILKERALICRLKENSRQGETDFISEEIGKHRPLKFMEPPATLDGGDVLDTGKILFAGLSGRTNPEGIDALRELSQKPVVPVRVLKGLHLKNAVSYLGNDLVVLNPLRIDPEPFQHFKKSEVSENESYAANCLRVGETVIMAAGFPAVEGKIKAEGFKVLTVEMTEFEKADGGVTCLSLIFPGE